MSMNRAFRDHGDVPAFRAYAWNVAAVLVAAGALCVAHRLGVLGVVLAAIVALVAATWVAIVRIEGRRSAEPSSVPDEVAEEHKRVTAAIAARRLREAA